MMVSELFLRQQAAGFRDVAGAEVTATIPISDRLVNEILSAELSPSAPVRDVRIEARADNTFGVHARLARPAFLPPFSLSLAIARQPELPRDPELVLQVASGALMALASPVLRLFDALPRGVRTEGDRVFVNVRTLLEQRGLAEVLRYLEDVRIATDPGRIILIVRARVPLSAR